jgi:hypothetical protein
MGVADRRQATLPVMDDHTSAERNDRLDEFADTVSELSSTFVALREGHGHEEGVFTMIRILSEKSKSWAVVHLAVAVAALPESREPTRSGTSPDELYREARRETLRPTTS